MRLTERAHMQVVAAVEPGATVVDATAGNGWDTLFLARCVGPTGRVYAFEVQPQGVVATRQRLQEADMAARVHLIAEGHEHLAKTLGAQKAPALAAVMFNLGYLPGSDKSVTTQPHNTVQALDAALRWLAPGGLLSVLAYRGHAGGDAEYDAVRLWMGRRAGEGHAVQLEASAGPVLMLLRACPGTSEPESDTGND